MILALASILVVALAFTRRPATIGLPAKSLISTSRHVVTGSWDTEESKKAAISQYQKVYNEKNKDAIRQRKKIYREKNKEAINQRAQVYYEENKDAIIQRSKVYREKNKDAISQRAQVYYEENKDVISLRGKVYYQENQDSLRKKVKVYYDENTDDILGKERQDRNLEREKYIVSYRRSIAQDPIHSERLLSAEEHDAIYHRILHEKRDVFEGLTLAQAIDSGKWTFYFSASKVPGIEEKLVCLTTRRISHRPVLLMTDGTRIRKNFAKSQLGAVGMVLHRSRLVFNELQLLWRLQETYHHLPLGYRRLNRHVGQPNYRAAEEIDDDKTVCSLYFNCFPVTSQDTPEINGIPLMLHPSIDP